MGKESSEELGRHLAQNGQVLLPMVELIEQSKMAVDELIDVLADFRDKGTRVAQGIQDLPGIQFRKSHDPAGGLHSSIYFRTSGKPQRDRFIAALEAENIPADRIEGSVILPIEPFIEKKQTVEAGWPSLATADGKAVPYGATCCSRTIDSWNRYVGVLMDPRYSTRMSRISSRRFERFIPR